MKKPINTERNGKVLHCPLTVHPQGASDILPGFKERCNKEGAVLIIYEEGAK